MRSKHNLNKMADIVAVLDKLKEDLTCSICRELLREPKTLPCLHSFCQGCLEGHVRTRILDEQLDPPDTRDVVPCPNCNFRARLGGGGGENGAASGDVPNLRTNSGLKNLVEHYELGLEVVGRSQKTVTSRCGNCSAVDNEAVAFCQTRCNRFLCRMCVQAHKRTTLTSKHKIVTLEEVRLVSSGENLSEAAPVVVSYKPRKCSKHFTEGEDDPNERMTDMIMYCHHCKEVICCMCALAEHQSHPKNFAKTVIHEQDHRPRIEAEIEETEKALGNVDMSSAKLYQRRIDIEDARSSTEKAIEDQFTRLNTELETDKESLLRSLNKMHILHTERLEKKREELDKRRKEIDHVLKFVERRLTLGSPEDILHLTREMREQMSALVDESKRNPPVAAYRREIKFVKGDLNVEGAMGNVSAEPCIEIFTVDDISRVDFVRKMEAQFTITARDVLKNETTADDEMVFVQLCPVAHENEVVQANVKKLKSGKCRVTLTPQRIGPHQLQIQVAEAGVLKHIKDSPFQVEVAFHPLYHLWEV